jgi:hypothetical protein
VIKTKKDSFLGKVIKTKQKDQGTMLYPTQDPGPSLPRCPVNGLEN